MEKNSEKPSLDFDCWLVNKEDLRKIYNFLNRRYPTKNIEFKLNCESGDNRQYETFEEYENDIAILNDNKENVSEIYLSCSNRDEDGFTAISLDINFKYMMCFFRISGIGVSEQKKDWIEGAYEDMKKIHNSINVVDIDLIKKIEAKFKKKDNSVGTSVIIEDFNGLLKKEFCEPNKREKTEIGQLKQVMITDSSFLINSSISDQGKVIMNSTVKSIHSQDDGRKNILSKLFSNPWVTGVGVTLIGGLIFYYIQNHYLNQ